MQNKFIKNIFKVSLSWIAARRSKHSLAFLNIQTLFWNESYGDSLFWELGQSFESWAWITKLLRMCPERVKGNAGVSALPLWGVGSPFSIAGRVIQNDHPKSFYIWRLLLYFLHKYNISDTLNIETTLTKRWKLCCWEKPGSWERSESGSGLELCFLCCAVLLLGRIVSAPSAPG